MNKKGVIIMYEINFENKQHIYFIGIGGISMSGLAEILLKSDEKNVCITIVFAVILRVKHLLLCEKVTIFGGLLLWLKI